MAQDRKGPAPAGEPEPQVDLSYCLRAIQNHRLRQCFGPHWDREYSLLYWHRPADCLPEDASFILLRCLDTDGKTVFSCPASYEGGHFRDLLNDDWSLVINPAVILGWSMAKSLYTITVPSCFPVPPPFPAAAAR